MTTSTVNAASAYFDNYDEKKSFTDGNMVVTFNSKNFSSMALDRKKTYYYAAYVSMGSFSPIFVRGNIKSITTE